jgi:O-antigen/teichoic acid export membrane protein
LLRSAAQTSPLTPEQLRTLRTYNWIKKWGLTNRWLDAAPVISILSLMGFLSSINQYNTNIFLVFERPYFVTIFTAINSITNIFLLFIFAKYGLLIVAAMLALRVFLITPIAFGVALHLLKVEWIVLVKKLLPSLSSVAVMSLSLLVLKSTLVGVNPALSLIVCIPVGVLIYMCSAYLTDRETFQLLIRSALGK